MKIVILMFTILTQPELYVLCSNQCWCWLARNSSLPVSEKNAHYLTYPVRRPFT